MRGGFLVVAAVTATAAAGCSSTVLASDGLPVGTALGGEGPQTFSTLTQMDTKVGHSYRVAFPELVNTSSAPLTIVGYHWETIPTGVTIGAVHVYSTSDSDGIQLSYRDGQDDGVGLPHWHDYVHEPMHLQPKEESTKYAMISFTVDKVTTGSFRGCVITYRRADRVYSQTLHCHFVLQF